MKFESEGQLLRIFVGENDLWEGVRLYEAIVLSAREHGLAGATVWRGLAGFGAGSQLRAADLLQLSEEMPIVIEIVDRPDRIANFLPRLDRMVGEGMITLEKVSVLKYRENHVDGPPPSPVAAVGEPAAKSSKPKLFADATDRVRNIIALAKIEAARSHRGFIDSVDVLLAMLHEQEGIAGNVLRNVQISPEAVEKSLREQVNRESPTDAYMETLNAKSMDSAKWLGHNYAGTEHLLLALCEVRPSAATDILMQLGVQPREVCREVLNILGQDDDWQRWLADHPDM